MFTYSAHFKYEVWLLIDLCINWPISIIGEWLCMHMYFGTIQVLHQIIDRNKILIDGPLGRPSSGTTQGHLLFGRYQHSSTPVWLTAIWSPVDLQAIV
jgi:hypothetical protein